MSLNLFLTHLRAQIACYELKGDLSPVIIKEIFHDSFENFQIYKDLYSGKPCKPDSVIQKLLTFGGRCNRYLWDIRLKMLRLPNFDMLFQLVLTKLNCFRVYRKLITWSCHAKGLLPLDGAELHNALIRPHFDFADTMWGDGDNNTCLMHDLQVLQNKAAKGILDRPNYASSTVALKTLGWPTLSQERLVHWYITTFKYIHGLYKSYIF